jgi:hypothetical protein
MIAPAIDEHMVRRARRRQIAGLVWIVLAVFLFAAVRAGHHAIFLPRWWRMW